MKFGVVIVTYNRLELLKECVEACLQQTLPFDRICIVNNASTDGTADYLKTLSGVETITLSSNTGGAGGFYEGVRFFETSDVDYVLLIDDDAIIDRTFNRHIADCIAKAPEGIAAYSGTVKTEGNIQVSHRRHLPNVHTYKEKNSKLAEYEADYFDYEISTFCGLLVPRKLIPEIGYPNKDFFIWYDDSEYSMRLLKYGRIRNANRAMINHKVKLSAAGRFEVTWKHYYGQRNLMVSVRKHFSAAQYRKLLIEKKAMQHAAFILWKITGKANFKNLHFVFKDAIADAAAGRLGINQKYYPGKKL